MPVVQSFPLLPRLPARQSPAAMSSWRAEQLGAKFERAEVREYYGHKRKVHSVDWSMSGKKLASGSVDQTARVWTIEGAGAGRDVELRGHSDSVDQIAWDPTHAERLVTASADRTIKVWDANSAKCTATVATDGENINVAWSPDGRYVAVGTRHDHVHIVDVRKAAILQSVEPGAEVNEIRWAPSGDRMLFSMGTGRVDVRAFPALDTVLDSVWAHTTNIYSLAFDRTGKLFATGAADALVSLWDAEENVCLRSFARLDWPVRAVTFSHDSTLIASASEDPFIDISEVDTGAKVHALPVRAAVNSIAWHPSKYLLAYACDEASGQPQGAREPLLHVFGFAGQQSAQ